MKKAVITIIVVALIFVVGMQFTGVAKNARNATAKFFGSVVDSIAGADSPLGDAVEELFNVSE